MISFQHELPRIGHEFFINFLSSFVVKYFWRLARRLAAIIVRRGSIDLCLICVRFMPEKKFPQQLEAVFILVRIKK